MCQGLLEESDGEGEPGEGQDEGPEAGDPAARGEASPVKTKCSWNFRKKDAKRRSRWATCTWDG